jgi:DNA-directed RNA polymerase specialized sigma24 family protein
VDDRLQKPLDADMARLADGDRAVFSSVFRLLWPVVHAFCARNLSTADADDAAQQVMEKVFAQASRYDGSRPALPWVLAISAWECRTLRKRRERRREDPLASAPEPLSTTTPEDAVVVAQLVEAASSVFGQLSPIDQQAIALAYAEEAPEHLDVPAATLRKRKERALKRFREAWSKLYGG